MATKVYDINTAEALIAGSESAPCKKCGESNWAKAAPSKQTSKPGMLTVKCLVCASTASSASNSKRYANDEKFREAQKAYHNYRWVSDEEYREAEKARKSAWQKDRCANDKEYHEALKAASLAWQKENPGKANAQRAKRRATKLQATPSWAETDLIREFYVNCPAGHHVDHIVPLQGRKVSGLHVLANLQYLTASENLSKSNKHTI